MQTWTQQNRQGKTYKNTVVSNLFLRLYEAIKFSENRR